MRSNQCPRSSQQDVVRPAPAWGSGLGVAAPSLGWREEAFLSKAAWQPLTQGVAVTAPLASCPPHPQSLRREETPGSGGFLWRRHAPWPLPLDTLVFFVTCFSFCFSSLLPFFRGHFHFRLAVSPHSTPIHPFCSATPPTNPPATLGSPVGTPRWLSGALAPPGSLLSLPGPQAPLPCDESKNINLGRCEEKRR